ncbi:50S ribosomal protein L11 methyltransferase [Chitinophaga alhagiae]|uniref:Ribosomal protein L11 methyltransferase n=1 Tax=Chitinophaga alhagiae TaxID=2203219 RepID=A0ABN5LM63_9BACT|nr:50S ribosomal protein L11 methyltransferase [Chitinophaga alhagiae]AWO00466.1 50S ribosomal protein L11 methyltransferase [Chitinophaga alhagiae]
MSHIAVTIAAPAELKDILIAQLADTGYEGFEETADTLVAYIPENEFDEQVIQGIAGSHGLDYTKERIEQANWNAVWESNFQPVLVDRFCGIRAAFHEPLGAQVQHEIVITPKMSFGTGHHATTWSVIKLMEGTGFHGKKVFDFGTGTGILAILADRLGAAETDAIDNDEWAVENAVENVAGNQSRAVRVWQADRLDEVKSNAYDVVLANINRNILLANMSHMKRILKNHGLLILSGILQEDEHAIVQAAAAEGLHMERKADREHWLALSFTHG